MAIQYEQKTADAASMSIPLHSKQKNVPSTDQAGLALEIGFQLDPGIRRKQRPNEDTLCVRQASIPSASSSRPAQPLALLVVADGMGGQGHGQEASQLATNTLVEYVERALQGTTQTPSNSLLSLLQAGVQHANQAVCERNKQLHASMGTTMTAMLVAGTTAYVAHVGDSRLYGYRPGTGLLQMTRDHSLVALLVAAGTLAQEDIYTHPGRNQIYRCLGTQASVDIDTLSVPLQAGDLLLLCTDGLWEMVRDTRIASVLNTFGSEPASAAHELILAALDGGGLDNVSVIVAHIVDDAS